MVALSPLHALVVAAEGTHVTVAVLEFWQMIHLPEPAATVVSYLAVVSFSSLALRALPAACTTLAQGTRSVANLAATMLELLGSLPGRLGTRLVGVRRGFGVLLQKAADYFRS